MTLAEEILTILANYPEGYRLMRMEMHGRSPRFLSSASQSRLPLASNNTIRVTLSRMKKNGLLQNNNGLWKRTRKGKEYLARALNKFPKHSHTSSNRKLKNMIIAFDIPEVDKRKRHWLRTELVNHGFHMLQKSVWFGSAPLPVQFIESLQKLELLQHMKFFEAKEADIV